MKETSHLKNPKVRIIAASLNDYQTIQNMARFYVYDRTPYMKWECPESGLFECIDFKDYFNQEPLKYAFLIRVDHELAGFVLLDKFNLVEGTEWNMGEFFILAKFQHQGIGTQVAKELFSQFSGKWSVGVMQENLPATTFWRKVIHAFTQGKCIEILKTEEELRSAENPDPDKMIVFSFKV